MLASSSQHLLSNETATIRSIMRRENVDLERFQVVTKREIQIVFRAELELLCHHGRGRFTRGISYFLRILLWSWVTEDRKRQLISD